MANAVDEALAEKRKLIVEAGTGTGARERGGSSTGIGCVRESGWCVEAGAAYVSG